MTHLKLAALIILAALAVAPGLAQARTHQHHIRYYGLPYEISYQHNYGPGSLPGTKPASMTATIRIDAPAPIIRKRPNRSHSQPDSGEVTYMPAR